MARFNFKRVNKRTRKYVDLFNEGQTPDTIIIQSTDLFDKENTEIFEGDILEYNYAGEVIKFEVYYCSGLCRFEVEVQTSNLEVEFGDFILNYLPFSKIIGNTYAD